MNIDELLKAGDDEQFLKETGWLTDTPTNDLQKIYEEFRQEFRVWLGRLSDRLGQPDFTRTSDRELAEDIYPEAFELAGWKSDGGYRLLAATHHDRETPVLLSFGFRETAA